MECSFPASSSPGPSLPSYSEARLDAEVPIIFSDLVRQGADACARPLEALGGTDDPNVVPHRAPELIPVVGKYYAFVRVARCPVDPSRQWRRWGEFTDDFIVGGGGAVVGEHHRLKQ